MRPSQYACTLKHHGDIFEIEKSSRDCSLCRIIFQAFEDRKVEDPELAKGLPIVFRALCNRIDVCYGVEKDPIKLCGLDIYMDNAEGQYFFWPKLSDQGYR